MNMQTALQNALTRMRPVRKLNKSERAEQLEKEIRAFEAWQNQRGCRRCGQPTDYNFCSDACSKENNIDMAKGSYASPEAMTQAKIQELK
jgi:hypothetical protein